MNRDHSIAIQRLTALWAFSESGIGGVMHLLKIPFTGLVLGGLSVIIISILAHLSDNKFKTIFGALMLVCMIKLVVSPQASFTAYVAISFQAVVGALFYAGFGLRFWSILLVSMLSLLESAFQKLILLTLIYGKSFWDAIDNFGQWVVSYVGLIMPFQSSKLLIGVYLGMYIVGGILVGLFSYNILREMRSENYFDKYSILVNENQQIHNTPNAKRNKWKKWMWVLIGFGIVIGFLFWTENEYWKKIVFMLLRATLVLVLLYGIVGPLALKLLNKYLSGMKDQKSEEIGETLNLFPYIRYLARLSWEEANRTTRSRFQKLFVFLKSLILYTIHFRVER